VGRAGEIALDYLAALLALALLGAESVALGLKCCMPLAKLVRAGKALLGYLTVAVGSLASVRRAGDKRE
jgi:hypothetical protein